MPTGRDRFHRQMSYSYKITQDFPDPMYFSHKDAGVLYGIELECAHRPTVKDIVDSTSQMFFVCKQDSSITGADPNKYRYLNEIITRPATRRVHRMMWNELFEKYPAKENFDQSLSNSNGLHIHIEREGFSTKAHLRNFCYFMNAPQHELWGAAISTRTLDNFFHGGYCPRANYGRQSIAKAIQSAAQASQSGRGIVNLSNHRTVEVRMFYGAPNYAHVMRCIEYVDSVVEFTRSLSIVQKDNRNLVRAYVTWLGKQPVARYRVLNEFMKRIDTEAHIKAVDFLLPGVETDMTADEFNDMTDGEWPHSAVQTINHQKGMAVLTFRGGKTQAMHKPKSLKNAEIFIMTDFEQEALAGYGRRPAAAAAA